MRVLFAVALAAACLMALSDDGQAKFVCGQFEEGFTCKYIPGSPSGGPTGQYKGPPVAPRQGSSGSVPVPYPSEPLPPPPDSGWSATTSQPPSAATRTCPPNTELLGGNCVPYTAQCKTALALDALPQPCAGVEEKQVCKPRADGLKDCCCITYSKF